MSSPNQIYPQQSPPPSPQRQQRDYAFTAPLTAQNNTKDSACYEGMLSCLGSMVGTLGTFVPCCPNPFKPVGQGTVGLICKFGRFVRAVNPGLYRLNPFCEKVLICDVRLNNQDIPRQTVLTKDNVSVLIDTVMYWEVIDPFTAVFQINNVEKALVERAQSTMRMVMGSRTLQDTIEHRDEVAKEVKNIIDSVAESWGVRVESILLKDVILGPDLLANMSSAATQRRLGESKVIAAQAEVSSARLMREAADILSSPAAMQIRYLETLNVLASTPNTKVIFMPKGMSD